MAYFRREAPNTQELNAQLTEQVNAILQRAALIERVSQCQHDWKHWVDESYDGHRTDRSDEYTCTKCGYNTARPLPLTI